MEVDLSRTMPSTFVRLTASIPRSTEFAVLLAFMDITERRQHEEQLERTEDALREADRRKDQFLATLSHELRNPLAPIRNGLFVLEHGDLNADNTRQTLAVIDGQVSHLSRLVDDLLDVRASSAARCTCNVSWWSSTRCFATRSRISARASSAAVFASKISSTRAALGCPPIRRA